MPITLYNDQGRGAVHELQYPKAMITRRVPLADVAEAYHLFSAKLNGCIKPMFLPNGV